MPNAIGSNGLTTATQAELLTFFTTSFQSIYGADIDLDPDSPDGQLVNIFIQSVLDLEDLITQVYNMFDPDNAIGVVLDQRVAINGIQRQQGTYTVTNITLITMSLVFLYGLDQTAQPVYTVSDNAGNQWQLQVTQNSLTAGTHVLAFQAANPGALSTIPNTITVPVTIVVGVSSINNPSTYTTLGTNEESDAALKIRRQKSVALGSQGYYAGLYAALNNIPGVTSAQIYENDTSFTDINGIPGHSIWVVVGGAGMASAIANAIYTKRNAGCGMKGSQSFVITQVDGSFFTVYWDDTSSQNLFIKFTATSLNGVNPPNIAAIISGLASGQPMGLAPGVGAQVNINDLATLVQEIDPNTLVTNAGFSLSSGGSFTPTLSPTTKQQYFVVLSSNVIILPIILSPAFLVLGPNTTLQLIPLGGYGPYTYVMTANPSGGSVNASTGLYTSGATTGVDDIIQVTDSQSNTATSTINVLS